jgi:hypothetical protein
MGRFGGRPFDGLRDRRQAQRSATGSSGTNGEVPFRFRGVARKGTVPFRFRE